MRGPFALEVSRIDILIVPNRPGVYGISNTPNRPTYVARSDTDLNLALKRWVGKYKYFWFEYALSPKEAYLLECQAFHKNADKGLENELHPGPPENIKLKCPVCGEQ
ncbi:MAG: hypothetical protein ABIK67_08415 [candidate division WOR-3 bacterium]